MKCPVCSQEMIEEDFGVNVKVSVCENGCKGIWFPHWALQKLDQNNQGVGKALEAALNSPRANGPDRGPIQCPVCHIPMYRHLYSRDQEVKVDECYNCEGFFLDSGELSAIRNKSMSDKEVDGYVHKLVGNVTGNPNEVAQDEEIIAENAQRNDAVYRFAKILQTHYWDRAK
jgi:Zn-finger nucleic acid-binding protein